MAIYGYVRVSSTDQNEDRQLIAMNELHIPPEQNASFRYAQRQRFDGHAPRRHRTSVSFAAQNERDNIRKRQAEGIRAARIRGVHFGRPVKKPPENFNVLKKQWECGKLSIHEFMDLSGLKESTLYRRLREFRLINNK